MRTSTTPPAADRGQEISPTRFVVATAPAAGHVNPLVPIATELVRRGHEVVWLTGRDYQATVERTGARFEPLVAAYDPIGESLVDRFPERSGLEGLSGIIFDLKHAFLDQVPPQAGDLQDVLSRYPTDLVVADAGFLGAAAVHELGGPAYATVGITPVTLPSRDLAPFGAGLPPIRTMKDRLRSTAVGVAQGLAMRGVEKHHRQVRAGMGLPAPKTGLFTAFASPYLVLQTGTEAFEYPRSDLPQQVHYVGPLFEPADSSVDPVDWRAIADGRPIVVVTQGTIADGEPDLVAPALDGLADEDVFVVAITATWPEGREAPANSVVLPRVPYAELVPHASAMVTNGGNGGVQRALTHGVPLVVAGTTEDKPEVGARVAWHGAGINLRTARPTALQVRDAVRRVLEEATFQQSADRIRADYARHQPAVESADLLEDLIRRRAQIKGSRPVLVG